MNMHAPAAAYGIETEELEGIVRVWRGDLLLAVSTGGASPGLARRLKAYLAETFGEEWADHVSEIAGARARWREEGVSFADLGKRTNALIDEKGWLS